MVSFDVHAQSSWPVMGRGSASGFCQGDFAYTCIQSLEMRAKGDAERDARLQCSVRSMFLVSASCQATCFPYMIPPGSPSTHVRCQADCHGYCQ